MEKVILPWNSIGHILEESAKKYPNKPLLIFEGERLSFSEVDKKVNQLANSFKSIGLVKGDKVSVMLPNCLDFPITWLAIAKIGAVMVPTNIEYKEQDLEYILTDSEASYMVIHQDFLPTLEKIRENISELKEIIVVGEPVQGYKSFDQIINQASNEFAIEDINENDMINIQYTSGTTGFPKGCMLTHRYWMLFWHFAPGILEMQPGDVHLTAQPFYYMDPLWNLVVCMGEGLSLVIMQKFSVSKFWPTVNENHVTFFYLVGTMFNLLMSRDADELEKNHKVRKVTCSGIVPQLHEKIEKRFNVPIRDGFGMTETGMDTVVPFSDTSAVGSGAIGAAIHTKEARVVDSDDKDVPDGTVGELVLRGEPMMLGYWKKPEATKEVFQGGWLHTGDLAYKDEKGYFHWVGRAKDMVRRGGENISTAEVEGVLSEHDKIKMSAVVPVSDLIRGEEVKAYIVLKEGETKETVSPMEIVGFTKARLARFKTPRYIEYADDLPRTPSERVEKHKLIKAKDDLRLGAYDAEGNIWITESILEKIKKDEKLG